jgi:NADH:ubiquinone reductase (non-electrogenic)
MNLSRIPSKNFYNQIPSRILSAGVSNTRRETVVILGSGWGSYSVLKSINKEKFDVIVVSPRNHFLFTPLLASTTVGTLEFRSIIEPVRNAGFRDDHHFHSSHAVDLNTQDQSVTCQSELDGVRRYSLSYDKLIIGVGAMSNTFGVPGVEEHAFFLKEVSDARKIRNRILANFELATQPGVSRDEQERLLHLVIVGGGPTGVEFGAEFYDFLKQDVSRLYQSEREMVKVTIIEAKQILSSFDKHLQEYAEAKIRKRRQMEILQDSVTEVTSRSVKLKSGAVLSCGLVVWSAGLAPRPFVDKINLEKNSHGQVNWMGLDVSSSSC